MFRENGYFYAVGYFSLSVLMNECILQRVGNCKHKNSTSTGIEYYYASIGTLNKLVVTNLNRSLSLKLLRYRLASKLSGRTAHHPLI